MPLSTTPAMLRLITLLALTSMVRGIRFNISTPMQCEPLEVTWEEKQGDGDMRLLIMPVSKGSLFMMWRSEGGCDMRVVTSWNEAH